MQHLHCFVKNEVHMYVQAMKYELGNFSDSAYRLNALIDALKTAIAQYKGKL